MELTCSTLSLSLKKRRRIIRRRRTRRRRRKRIRRTRGPLPQMCPIQMFVKN
jgi:hypothetical protein